MKTFEPIWAVRSDFLMTMHRMFAAGEEPDITSAERSARRAKKFELLDALPKEIRLWIHENGPANIPANWQRGERNPKVLIKKATAWVNARKPTHSVCINNPTKDADDFLKELGL